MHAYLLLELDLFHHVINCSCTEVKVANPLPVRMAFQLVIFYQGNLICDRKTYNLSKFIKINSINSLNKNYTYTTRLSCLRSLFVNSDKISRKDKLGGGPVGSCSIPSGGVIAKRTPARCKAVIASRFFTASKPNDKANRFASS